MLLRYMTLVKTFTKAYAGDTQNSDNSGYHKTINISPSDATYARVTSNLSALYYGVANIIYKKTAIEYISDSLKNDYIDNTIFFTVQVNQDFSNNTGITTSIQDTETFEDVYCALKLPTNYLPTGIPVKIAVVMHGAGGKVTDTDEGEMKAFESYLNGAGYAIFDVNGSNDDYSDGTADHMGSSRALSAYIKAFEYIRKHYNVEDKLYVHGHSMGGLTALNLSVQRPDLVKVLGLYHPVTDMYNQAWLHPWYGDSNGTYVPTKVSIAKEYNFNSYATYLTSGLISDLTYESDKVIGFNPINNKAIVIDSTRYIMLPVSIKVWHGNADPAVSLSGTQDFITAVKNGGGRAELRIIDGLGHSIIDCMYQELVMWFNRF